MSHEPIPVWVRDEWRSLFSPVPGVRMIDGVPGESQVHPVVIDHRMGDQILPGRPVYPVIIALPAAKLDLECHWLGQGADACVFLTENLLERVPACVERARARRRAINRVRKEDLRYQAMVENLLDVVTLIDGLGIIHYESPSLHEVFGFRPEELVGRNSMEFVHPGDVPRLLQLIAEGRDEPGYSATTQYRFKHKNGTWKVVESKAVNLLHDPAVQSIVVISRDVTERQKSEDSIRASRSRLAALLAATPDAYVLIDREGVYHDVHIPPDYPATIPAEDLVGKRLTDVLPPTLASQAHEAVVTVLKTEKPVQFDYSIQVGGQVRFREARVVPFSDQMALSVQRDITERMKVLERLRLSEFRFRSLFQASPDAIFVESIDGIVLDVNPAACELHGSDREWLLGKHVTELVPERLRDQVRRGFRQVVEGEVERGESFSLRKDGTLVPVEFRVGRTVFEELPALLFHVRDISRQREQEDLIRRLASYQQEAIERERSRISREVHDVLGQALTGLRFDVSRIARQLGGGLSEEATATTEAIDQLISDVRRIASDLRPWILDDLGLSAAVEWHAKEVAKRAGLNLNLEVDAAIVLDPDRSIALFRVLQELLTNVVRHAGATEVCVELRRQDRGLRLSVVDNGSGMEPRPLESRQTLGLMGIKERLQAWGGRLDLASNSPSGTIATAHLPNALK